MMISNNWVRAYGKKHQFRLSNPVTQNIRINIYTMLHQRRKRWRRCMHVLHMFCVCWEGRSMF